MTLKIYVFALVLYLFEFCSSAPIQNLDVYSHRDSIHTYGAAYPRLPTIGDLISSSSWFPIEINIPDIFGNIISGIQAIPPAITNGISGVITVVQRIPFINRIISQERPRPYLVFIPDNLIKQTDVNYYSQEMDLIPSYP